jgi:DNA-binding NtrC family response regulator
MGKSESKLVFVVEDNEMYSFMLTYLISNDTTYQCKSFSTGEECIKNLHLNPSMIILDYFLPGINGKETLLQIKKYKPDVPVIILSRNENIYIARDILQQGIYAYMVKEDKTPKQLKDTIDFYFSTIDTNKDFDLNNPKKSPVSGIGKKISHNLFRATSIFRSFLN